MSCLCGYTREEWRREGRGRGREGGEGGRRGINSTEGLGYTN